MRQPSQIASIRRIWSRRLCSVLLWRDWIYVLNRFYSQVSYIFEMEPDVTPSSSSETAFFHREVPTTGSTVQCLCYVCSNHLYNNIASYLLWISASARSVDSITSSWSLLKSDLKLDFSPANNRNEGWNDRKLKYSMTENSPSSKVVLMIFFVSPWGFVWDGVETMNLW